MIFSTPRRVLLSILVAVGSLHLALALIAIYVVVLAWGTLIESQYGAAAAHFGIYDSGWFLALGALLAINVFCALLVRFPWRWRQAGFVVTHLGILVLLAGCLLSQRGGIEAQLPIFEGHTAHRAYQDSYHFQLRIEPEDKASENLPSFFGRGAGGEGENIHSSLNALAPTLSQKESGPSLHESIVIPFASGPFSWNQYASLPWFPWAFAFRDVGTIFERDGIVLEALDYRSHPSPSARVRLTVDGASKEFDLPVASDDPPEAEQCVVAGNKRRVSVGLRQDEIDLGFQLYLHRFRRKLDPGADMPSHYSSLVDILDRGDPAQQQKLRRNVLITLNEPVDFTDPRSGRTYRLFQSSFEPPYLPGDPKFDALVGGDRGRTHVYLSRLSVNSDPGRTAKYTGCLLIVVGILAVYYLRPQKFSGQARPLSMIFFTMLLALTPGGCRAEDDRNLDWSAWRHLPVFGEGRVVPLDTFARETVEAICGRSSPTLALPGASPRTFDSAELLFSWLAEPKTWENTPFLAAGDQQLREEVLGLPLYDENGRRLLYITPAEVENNVELGRRWGEMEKRAELEGKQFRLAGVDKKVKELVDAYAKFRLLTYDPHAPKDSPRRFYSRIRSSADAWRKLAVGLQNADRIHREDDIRNPMVQSGQTLKELVAQAHSEDFSLETIEKPVVEFCRAGETLAKRLAGSPDKPLSALAFDLHRQATEMHLAMYDDGETLRLVPALNPGAFEADRAPHDDAVPWLSFQALIDGSDALLRDYPQPELKSVREAWAAAKTAYLDRTAKFAAAMDRFVAAVRGLGQNIEPLRERMLIQNFDQDALAATAYPTPGSTDLEVFYNRLDPFFWSWVVSLIATVCLLLAIGRLQRPAFWLGVFFLVIAVALTTLGMTLRGCVTGLVPLTGMFETVVFVALYATMLGLWYALKPLAASQSTPISRMDAVLERRPFALAGAIVGFMAVMLACYAPATVMHRHIGAVAPILRDNFWLAVHVVTIMASYASAAIALILGDIALGYYLFGAYRRNRPPEACSKLAGFIYAAIRITVLLLAAGTILGALWADVAWGRFWAWDPKEVWALISLLVYVLILHARYIGWAGDFGMALAAVFGATAVLFTWYGVNFLLGSGMHSYGSGAGGQWAVGTAVAVQWLFLAVAGGRYLAQTTEKTVNATDESQR